MLMLAGALGNSKDCVGRVLGTARKHRFTLQVMQVHSLEAVAARTFVDESRAGALVGRSEDTER